MPLRRVTKAKKINIMKTQMGIIKIMRILIMIILVKETNKIMKIRIKTVVLLKAAKVMMAKTRKLHFQ